MVEGEKGENEATPSLDVEQNEEQLKPEPRGEVPQQKGGGSGPVEVRHLGRKGG